MLGDNPKRPQETGDGLTLGIKEIFPTFQGEGPFTGYPAVFVRLGGCNLACKFCDTDFEDFQIRPTAEIISEIKKLSENSEGKRVRNLVVITGGEPLRQNINPLCNELLADGFTVQIETNGRLWLEGLDERVFVVCSPKQLVPLRDEILQRTQALKFLISAYREKYMEVPEIGQSNYNIPIYVQPVDEQDAEKNAANLARTVELAEKNGYRISLQMHKILGIA